MVRRTAMIVARPRERSSSSDVHVNRVSNRAGVAACAATLVLVIEAQRRRPDRPLSRGLCADRAEEAVLFVVWAGGEEQCVGRAVVGRAVTKLERPQAVDG